MKIWRKESRHWEVFFTGLSKEVLQSPISKEFFDVFNPTVKKKPVVVEDDFAFDNIIIEQIFVLTQQIGEMIFIHNNELYILPLFDSIRDNLNRLYDIKQNLDKIFGIDLRMQFLYETEGQRNGSVSILNINKDIINAILTSNDNFELQM